MNIQSINRRINIAKRIIRSSKREGRNERQHKATKYFTLKPSVKQSSVTWTIHFIKQKNLRQLLIHPFLSSDTNISKSGRNLQTVPLSRWTNIVFHQRKTILNSTTMLAKESSSQLQPSPQNPVYIQYITFRHPNQRHSHWRAASKQKWREFKSQLMFTAPNERKPSIHRNWHRERLKKYREHSYDCSVTYKYIYKWKRFLYRNKYV